MRTYKALGALLTYPDETLIGALDEIGRCVADEALVGWKCRAALFSMIDDLRSGDIWELQEAYIELFDRGRSRSLHLYEHLHGESRDRGSAMAGLAELYRSHGLEIGASELPDFLPLLCEFLSTIDDTAARTVLADASAILEAVRHRVAERESAYAAVFAALLELAGGAVDRDAVRAILEAEPAETGSLEELDREWEEVPVTFGPADPSLAGCPGAWTPGAQPTLSPLVRGPG